MSVSCHERTWHPLRLVPILGDAHLGNVFITTDSALWNDFEDACLGPREWDIGFLPERELAAFEPLNRDALLELGYLRSLYVSIRAGQGTHPRNVR
jgi:Ser/Thr protein kinase RdoA (MazF antagonist)